MRRRFFSFLFPENFSKKPPHYSFYHTQTKCIFFIWNSPISFFFISIKIIWIFLWTMGMMKFQQKSFKFFSTEKKHNQIEISVWKKKHSFVCLFENLNGKRSKNKKSIDRFNHIDRNRKIVICLFVCYCVGFRWLL